VAKKEVKDKPAKKAAVKGGKKKTTSKRAKKVCVFKK
jgi:hypothetical protein